MKTDALTRLTLLTMFLALVLFTTPVRGDWVKEWLSGSVTSYTGPSYIEAGRRGYLSFGSVSTRTLMTTDRLVTFTPPSLNFGCGGIDLFLGGFSLLDFDYMVDKFQRIISAAPAFAFEYALRSICEQCGTIMDALTSIQDLLNSLQLSDCQASRQLGYLLASLGDSQYAAMRENLKPVLAKLALVSGDFESWKEWIDEKFKNASTPPGKLSSSDNQKLNQDCPSYITNLLRTGSLVRYVRNRYFSALGDSFEAMVRGYLGDVVFYQSNGFWMANFIPPCGSKNEADPLEAMVSGRVLVNPSINGTSVNGTSVNGTANCQEYTVAYSSAKPLAVLVDETLTSVYRKLKNKEPLSDTEKNLLALLPEPIYQYLKQLYAANAEEKSVRDMSGVAAYGLAHVLLGMVYAEVQKDILTIKEFLLNRCTSELTDDKACVVCTQGSHIRSYLTKFQNSISGRFAKVDRSWQTKLAEFSQRAEVITALRNLTVDDIRAKLARRGFPTGKPTQ